MLSTTFLTTTFQECADAYLEMSKEKGVSHKYLAEAHRSVADYAYPTLGSMPVHQIDAEMVVTALAPIWSDKPHTANRVRMRRGKQDEKTCCLTGECSPDIERCLTARVPVASLISWLSHSSPDP